MARFACAHQNKISFCDRKKNGFRKGLSDYDEGIKGKFLFTKFHNYFFFDFGMLI